MKKIALFALALVFLGTALLSTSCSTAEGFGRDLQYLGRGIEKAAG